MKQIHISSTVFHGELDNYAAWWTVGVSKSVLSLKLFFLPARLCVRVCVCGMGKRNSHIGFRLFYLNAGNLAFRLTLRSRLSPGRDYRLFHLSIRRSNRIRAEETFSPRVSWCRCSFCNRYFCWLPCGNNRKIRGKLCSFGCKFPHHLVTTTIYVLDPGDRLSLATGT